MKRTLWRGSTLQSLAVIILPLTVLLVVVSLASFSVHQNAMRSVVGERDERSARSAAAAIASEINHRLFAVHSLALLAGADPQAGPQALLAYSTNLGGAFDYGTAFYQQSGSLLAASGDQAFWKNLAGTTGLTSVLNPLPAGAISPISSSPTDGSLVVLVSSPVAGTDRIAVGAFTPVALIQPTLQDIYPPQGGTTAVYIIDPSYQIVYHSGPATLETAPRDHPGVAQAFNGQSGTVYMKVGRDEHVVAFSPIAGVGWAIITEESWQMVSSPLSTSQIIPLVLVPALLLAMLALWFGAQQIVRPLRQLESRAARLAWGDFLEIGKPVGGIAEIRDLQNELSHMARQLQAAQKSLHSYIGAITQAQEAERLRLARELHDDTIQSLIALKQRVQMARLPRKKETPPPDLDELEGLIEQTIADLRRTTRALRPIYLEDLGLVAALEMLARETGQSSGLPVDFTFSGSERRLPAEVELAFYRMAQEALNNAVQHARASHILVGMEFDSGKASLKITDDGQGFAMPRTPAEFTPQGHFGLLGLYERAELIGAHLEIISSPDSGTHLIIELPLPYHTG